MPRRSKYTPELVGCLISAIEAGATDGDACNVVGIDQSTFYSWQKIKPGFSDLVTRARSGGWVENLRLIQRAAREGDWRAAAEHLDRTQSPYRKSVELTGKDGGPIMFDPNWMPIRAMIFAVLAAHPDALADVAGHLEQLSAVSGQPSGDEP